MTYLARVFVTLKEGVLDPQGKAVGRGLAAMGYPEVGEVRVGRYITLRLEAKGKEQAAARVDEMCRRLLANPVIEDYRFDLEEV